MSKLAGFFGRLLAREKACMAACLVVSLVSGSICAATAFDAPPGIQDVELPASMSNVSQVQAAEPETAASADDGSIPDDDCMYVFYSAWEGWEFKPSEMSDEYDVGDEIKITVTYNRSVGSQIATNVDGTWTTFAADGKTLEATFIPDDDWLNLQITDLKEASSVGVVSIDIEITLKNAARLARMNYTAKGDHHLFSGGVEEAYETDDLWLSYCDDTDWLTLVYDCTMSGQEGWGILGWGGSLNGEWINGPGYGADKKDSTAEVTVNFSVKYLRKMMHLSKGEDLDFTSLGAWSGGRIKSLVLHRGSLMPRNDVLFENGADNEEWVCKDIEQILDEDGSRFLCVKYTCSNEENYGWSVMGFGAGVDGEWRSGRTFKVSEYQPTRIHYDFMTVDQFRASMGLSWDVKVDSISLGVYNQGRILKLWLSDTPALDPGDDVEFEDEWESPNAKIYERVAGAEGTKYPQNIRLQEAWSQEHPAGEQEIIDSLDRQTFLVVSYQSAGRETPTLYIEMKDGKQSHVKAVWSDGKRAVYSYDCIAKMFPGYLIPEEMRSLAVSTAEKPMTISEIKTVVDDAKLEPEPLAVLTKNWSGFETEISKYHSGYEPGDTVRVTVRFDKEAPGTVAFHLNGKWRSGKLEKEKEFSVTATPDDDYMSIQIGEIPRTKEYVIIRSIRVEIVGKPNYTAAVVERGTKNALLSSGAMEATKAAGLTDEQIKNGRQLIVTTAAGSLNGGESAQVQALLETYADGADTSRYGVSDCVDISLAISDGKSETPVHQTPQKMSFKVPVPTLLKGGDYDFAVARLHNGSVQLLPDVDDEAQTITFQSDQFSRFAVVYGPKDCFKELRGDRSLHTFTGAWSGWEFSLNDYIEGDVGFGAGDTVKITVEFDKNTSSEINTNVNGTWTKLGAAGNSSLLMVTGKPDGDTVTLQLTDLMGEKSVKVMNVKVEITEAAPLPVFTEEGDKDIMLNKFLKDFVAGTDKVKITVKLSSDGAFKGNLMGNSIDKTGTGWHEANGKNPFESEDNQSTFTWITIPQYGNITVRISEMEGTQVKIDSVTVERTNEEDTIALPVFKKTGEKSLNLKSFLTDLAPGTDYVKVTVKLSSDGTFEGNLEGSVIKDHKEEWGKANTEADFVSDRSGTYVWCLTPVYDSITLKINKMSGREVKVDSVTVERTTREPDPGPGPEEGVIYTLTQENKNADLPLNGTETYNAGDRVKVTVQMRSDASFDGALCANSEEGDGSGNSSWQQEAFSSDEQNKCTATWIGTLKYGDTKIAVQCWNMSGTEVKVVGFTVERLPKEEKPGSYVHEFTKTYDGYTEKTLTDYLPGFEAGKETTVRLVFDKETTAEIGYHETKDSGWKTVAGDQSGKEITCTFTPPDNYMNIQLTDLKGASAVYLLSVEVTQGPVHVFAKPESEASIPDYVIRMGDYCDEYQSGDAVDVVVKLTSEMNFGGRLGTNTIDNGNAWKDGPEYKVLELENGTYEAICEWMAVQPSDGDLRIQMWWMSGESVCITSISVTKSEETDVSALSDEAAEDADLPVTDDGETPHEENAEPAAEASNGQTVDAAEEDSATPSDEGKEDEALLPDGGELQADPEEPENKEEDGENPKEESSEEDAPEEAGSDENQAEPDEETEI